MMVIIHHFSVFFMIDLFQNHHHQFRHGMVAVVVHRTVLKVSVTITMMKTVIRIIVEVLVQEVAVVLVQEVAVVLIQEVAVVLVVIILNSFSIVVK
jgi:hypothetical protein